MAIEKELKYKLKRLPTLFVKSKTCFLMQGYLIGINDFEERYRSSVNLDTGEVKFFRTLKSGSGMVRKEFEHEVTNAEFELAWPHTEGKRITKIRRSYDFENFKIEIDQYVDNPELIICEIEFNTEEPPRMNDLPENLRVVMSEEVTSNKTYSNRYMAK